MDRHVAIGDRAGGQNGLSAMGNVLHDRLTATVTNVDTATVKLSILASTVKVITFLNSSRMQNAKTTDTVQVDAQIVMRACARSVR